MREVQPAPGRVETSEWLDTFHTDDVESRRRKQMMPGKLQKLGLGKNITTRGAVLDLCCGHGEALDVLYEQGFRDVSGVDIHVDPTLSADKRFVIVEADACDPAPIASESKDWITCLHSLHHLETADRVQELIDSAYRVLKPGGRLSFIDFPNTPQIRFAFWVLMTFRPILPTHYLRWMGKITADEWPFLKHYMPRFAAVCKVLHDPRFHVEIERHEFFLFFLTLRKPISTAPRQR